MTAATAAATAAMAQADPHTLLLAIVLFFAAAALVWWALAAGARLAPPASLSLGLSNALLAGSLAAHLLRGSGPQLLAFWGSDLLAVGGFALLRAAVPAVAGKPLAWRSALAVWLPAALLLGLLPYDGDLRWHERGVFAALGLLSLLASVDAWRQLRERVSPAISALLVAPLALVCALMGLRLLANLLLPGEAADLRGGGAANVLWLWASLLLCMVLNATMAFLVLMRLILKIQQLTRRDPLTRALNRRALGELIEVEHARCVRGQAPYALVMIDMDHFKQLNDSLGHAAGDAALCRMVEALAGCVRDNADALGRLGGEEFCVLLPQTDDAGAALVAARMRAILEDCRFDWQGRPWPLTASFGIAVSRPEDLSAEAVLMRADEAMYRAKAQGRNVVLD
ncbi:MAG: GGDEF domain-containing protein [Burkholderiaceae bacterium]